MNKKRGETGKPQTALFSVCVFYKGDFSVLCVFAFKRSPGPWRRVSAVPFGWRRSPSRGRIHMLKYDPSFFGISYFISGVEFSPQPPPALMPMSCTNSSLLASDQNVYLTVEPTALSAVSTTGNTHRTFFNGKI